MPKAKIIGLCTPSLGTVSTEWAMRLRQIAWPLNTGYVPFFVTDAVGGEIAESRNRCVTEALAFGGDEAEVTHLFWLDDDVLCSRFALLKLMNHHADIASGVYFTKCETPEPLIFPHRFGGTVPFVPDCVFEAWGHGMGLTLIRTDVYRRMAAELNLPRDRYGNVEWYKTTGAEHTQSEGEHTLSMGGTEDLYFLHNAAALGYRPIVDTSLYAFGWHYDAKRRQGYPKPQWDQYRSGQPIVWQTPEGEKVWS